MTSLTRIRIGARATHQRVRVAVTGLLVGGLLVACAAVPGCAAVRGAGPARTPGLSGQRGDRPRIGPAELDELTRAFADRYVGLLSSTCDALKKDNPDPVQRLAAQELMLNSATNVYDIASNADAFTRTLDLVVVTTLVSGVWIDDGRAREVFGERSAVLVRALEHGRVEARALVEQVLAPDQLAVLDALMLDWRRENPDMVRMGSVRFSNFAIGRGNSSTAKVLAARGWFANVGTAGRSVDEARLLTERMFYMLKRQPTLLRWEVEAAKDELFATPDAATYLRDVHRLTEMAHRLPADVAAERQAIVAAVDARLAAVDSTLGNAKSAIAEADGLAATLGRTAESIDGVVKSVDGLIDRYGAASPTTGPSAATPARPFDVREYTAGVKELAAALDNMNQVLKSSDVLLGSSEWGRRIDEVNRSADARMRVAAEQGQVVVSAGFRQLWFTIAAVFALLVFYRVVGVYLPRRTSGLVIATEKGPRLTERIETRPIGHDGRSSGNGGHADATQPTR